MRRHETMLVAMLAALMLYAWRVDPSFVTWQAQSSLAQHGWEIALIAVPMTFIILTGGIDLSVGSIMALCAVAFGLGFKSRLPISVLALLVLCLGLSLGLINGLIITRFKVHPLIVTLATLSAYRGIAEGVSLAKPYSGFPANFLTFGNGIWPPILTLISFLAAILLLTKFTFGRTVIAVGNNEVASRFSGLSVDRVKLILYSWSGLFAGLATLILCARRNTAKADLGLGMELSITTAVVLGGVSIEGGRGSVLGVALGVTLLHELREFVSWHWQKDELNMVLTGVLLVGSVLIQQGLIRISKKKPVTS